MRRHELLEAFRKAVEERHQADQPTFLALVTYARFHDTRPDAYTYADCISALDALEFAMRLEDGTDKPQDFWDKPYPPYDGWDVERDDQIGRWVADWDTLTVRWWTS